MKLSIYAGILLASLLTTCSGKIRDIGLPAALRKCYDQVRNADAGTFVGSTFSWLCENAIMKPPMKESSTPVTQEAYLQHLYDRSIEFVPVISQGRRVFRPRAKLQAGHARCLRREYRMLTDAQRDNFHDAVNTLKKDKTVEPNKYDAIARLHATNGLHGGAGFYGWHRIYLLMFETALREVDDSVCLPYWDSSLDAELEDPTLSPVWKENFFGNFSNWMRPTGLEGAEVVQLTRNVHVEDGWLFTASEVEDVLTRTSYKGILKGREKYDLERHHGFVHIFVGGAMEDPPTAAYDPVFFMHHAFIDYVWELFRANLKDPEKYFETHGTWSLHHSTAQSFGNTTQADGYSKLMTHSYEYEASPSCSATFPDCGSIYLSCIEHKGRCVPTQPHRPQPSEGMQTSRREDQPVPNRPNPAHTFSNASSNIKPEPTFPNADACSNVEHAKRYGHGVQNDYCCDNICDVNQWATIPVKIVNLRPPKFNTYDSYPVKDGRVQYGSDIYAPSAYPETNKYISSPMANPKTFERCDKDEMVGQVFLTSKGINYNGFYKEFAIVDNRLAASISIGFVNVKKPQPGSKEVTKALLRAHDSCGRMCHPACKDPTTGEYKDCSGAVAISNDGPLMYGNTYDQAVMSVFDFKFNNDFPAFKSDNFFITFYCDYRNEFPKYGRNITSC